MNKRQKYRSELSVLPVDDWEQVHVAEWLQDIGIQGEEKLELLESIPSGSLLSQFSKEDVNEFSFLSSAQQQLLWKSIVAITTNQNSFLFFIFSMVVISHQFAQNMYQVQIKPMIKPMQW